MSAEPVVIVNAFKSFLESKGLIVFLDPSPIDLIDVGLRISYSEIGEQGIDREIISLDGVLSGRGIDPGQYLGKIMAQSRILSRLLVGGFEFNVSASLKAKAQLRKTAEGRFSKDETEDRYDWLFQAYYRIDLSYNPAILDNPELAV